MIRTGDDDRLRCRNEQAPRASRGQRRLVAALACSMVITGLEFGGESGSTSLSVTANVVAWARVHADGRPDSWTVTAADVARGFVDIEQPGPLTLRTNSPHGYELVLDLADGGPVLAAEVSGIGDPATVVPGGFRAPRSSDGPLEERLFPRWRFHLAEDAAPGEYAWPVRVAARPTAG